MLALLCMMAIGQSPSFEHSGKHAFLELLLSAYAPLDDVSFEYEGTLVYRTKLAQRRLNIGNDGVYMSYSGSYGWRRDGATAVNVYIQARPGNEITRDRVAVLGRRFEEYRGMSDDRRGAATISDARSQSYSRPGFPTNLPLFSEFIKLFDDPTFTFSDKGDVMLDDRSYRLVEFQIAPPKSDGDSGHFTGQRIWVDMARGCHPTRRESYSAGSLVSRATVALQQFSLPSGGPIWLPVSGTVEGFAEVDDNKKLYFASEVQNTEVLKIMTNTLQINRHPGDGAFALKYRPGTPVTDSLRDLRYEYGIQKTVAGTRAEAEEQLREQLRVAEEQRSELIASSQSREGMRWFEFTPWLGGVLTLAAACAIWYRRSRTGPKATGPGAN